MRILRTPNQRQIKHVEFSPDGRGLVVHGNTAVICWPRLNDGTGPCAYPSRSLWGVGYVAGGTHLVISKGEAGVWTQPTHGGDGHRCDLPPERIYQFVCSPFEPLVVVHQAMLYETPGALYCFQIDGAGRWTTVWVRDPNRGCPPFFSADGNNVWQIIYQGMLCHHTHTGETVEQTFPAPPGVPAVLPPLAVTADLTLAAKCVGRNLWIHPSTGAEPFTIVNDGRESFTAAAFHPLGKFLAVTSNDSTLRVYDTVNWRVATTFTWDIGRLRSVAFSQDGLLAAAGSDSTKLVVWDFDL